MATSIAQRLTSITTAVVVAAVCGVLLGTTGQAAAVEQQVLGRLDQPGTRLIKVEDPTGAAVISASSIEPLASVGGVEWVLGVGPVVDIRNSAVGEAGEPVPSRAVFGELPDEIEVSGRLPAPGEALVDARAQALLGLTVPAGGVFGLGIDAPVVGAFTADDPLAELGGGALVIADHQEPSPLREIYVMSTEVDIVGRVGEAARATVVAQDATQVRVETSQAVLDLRAVVAGDLRASSRQTLLGVLAGGLSLVATTLFGAVGARRREFGRRRALGASRIGIVLMVLVQTVLAAVAGVVTGLIAGFVVVVHATGTTPPPSFVGAVALLAVLVALVAALVPALLAAYRDPVLILRVP